MSSQRGCLLLLIIHFSPSNNHHFWFLFIFSYSSHNFKAIPLNCLYLVSTIQQTTFIAAVAHSYIVQVTFKQAIWSLLLYYIVIITANFIKVCCAHELHGPKSVSNLHRLEIINNNNMLWSLFAKILILKFNMSKSAEMNQGWLGNYNWTFMG